jgi:four helix bundle protein
MRPHQKLIAWQESINLVKSIYAVTMQFPESEKFGLSSQLRRSAVSVSCNIAEGAARRTKKEFAQFMYISSGSLSELDTLLLISKELLLLTETEFDQLLISNNKVTALVNGLINKLNREK